MFGLKDTDRAAIHSVLQNFPEVEEAVIFGSRATGTYHKGSDVDIALRGKHVTLETAQKVSYQLNEETVMPYQFDVINYSSISNADLTAHIDRVGVMLYSMEMGKIAGEPQVDYENDKHSKD